MKRAFTATVLLHVCTSLFSQSANTVLSSEGKLRSYGAENEGFFVNRDYSSTIRVTEGNFVEKKYDEKQRLSKEIAWTIDSYEPTSIREYTYRGESAIVQSIQFDEYALLQRTIDTYNEKSLIIKKDVFSIEKRIEDLDSDNETTEATERVQIVTDFKVDETKTALVFSKKISYDDEERIIEEIISYADAKKATEKTTYEFKLGNDNADVFYYEGEMIKKSIIYSSPDNRVEITYFPNNFYIEVLYENNEAIKEIVYENDIRLREREI